MLLLLLAGCVMYGRDGYCTNSDKDDDYSYDDIYDDDHFKL